MTIPTMIERTADGFRASTSTTPERTAVGRTAVEALVALQEVVAADSGGRDAVAGFAPPAAASRPPLADATWVKFRTAIDQYREEREAEELAREATDAARPAEGE